MEEADAEYHGAEAAEEPGPFAGGPKPPLSECYDEPEPQANGNDREADAGRGDQTKTDDSAGRGPEQEAAPRGCYRKRSRRYCRANSATNAGLYER
jgi:hypothetical protein